MTNKKLYKVGISDCVKQIIAINKELEDHDSRQDAHMIFIQKLQYRIEKLEQQVASSKQQAWQWLKDNVGWYWCARLVLFRTINLSKHHKKGNMKQFKIEVSHASPGQLQTIAAELKIMSNDWTKFGPRIMINGQKLQAPSLRIPGSGRKRGPRSGKPQARHN